MNSGSTSMGIHVEGAASSMTNNFVQRSSDFDCLKWIVLQRQGFPVPVATD
jgi:hypothetical protein